MQFDEGLSSLNRYEILMEDFGAFERWLNGFLNFSSVEINVDSFPKVFHRLTEHSVVHQVEERLFKIVIFTCAHVGVDVDISL